VWAAGKGPVRFDEVHQGYAAEPTHTFWGQLGAPLRFAFLQLVLAGIIWAWTVSRRFGPPVAPREVRRTAGEYLSSMGRLLSRAKGETTALEIIGAQFRHDLARWVGAPEDLPEASLIAAVRDRSSISPETLTRALAASGGQPPPG